MGSTVGLGCRVFLGFRISREEGNILYRGVYIV